MAVPSRTMLEGARICGAESAESFAVSSSSVRGAAWRPRGDSSADGVVAAVEARHYPAALSSARAVPLHRSMRMGLGSAARFLLVNLVMTPVYLALLVTGVGTAAAFFVVNARLLGRDLTDMVASRHLPGAAMRDWRTANTGGRFLLGLAGTGLFVVPVVNLLAPVLGAAMATHLFHRTRP